MFEVRRWRHGLVAAGCAALVAIAGCGGSDEESSAGSTQGATGGSATAADSGAHVEEAKQLLESFREGQFGTPPTTGPKPQPGKNIWILTYGLAASPAADFDRGVREAAKVAGWKTTSCDGKFSADQWQQCIRQATAAGADGLALYTVDCASTQEALRGARKAGVIIATAESADCDDQKPGAEPLFDAQLEFEQGSFRDWLSALLYPSIAYVVSELGADARVMLINETGNFATGIMSDAFRKKFKELCPACEIADTVDYSGDEFGAPLQAKVGQALLENPDVNAIVTPYDDAALNGVVQAVRESGRNQDDLIVTAGIGIKPALELVRENRGIDGLYAQDISWEGWGVADSLNRLFNGEKPQPSGQGIGWIDRGNVPPAGQAYEPPVDFAAIYRKTLGGGEQ